MYTIICVSSMHPLNKPRISKIIIYIVCQSFSIMNYVFSLTDSVIKNSCCAYSIRKQISIQNKTVFFKECPYTVKRNFFLI